MSKMIRRMPGLYYELSTLITKLKFYICVISVILYCNDVIRPLPKVSLRSVIEDSGLDSDWDQFVQNEYRKALDSQISGPSESGDSVYSDSQAGVMSIA